MIEYHLSELLTIDNDKLDIKSVLLSEPIVNIGMWRVPE